MGKFVCENLILKVNMNERKKKKKEVGGKSLGTCPALAFLDMAVRFPCYLTVPHPLPSQLQNYLLINK